MRRQTALSRMGGYLRALSEGRLGNILQIRDKDLVAWRRNNDLKAQPAVIIASASLNFPMQQSQGTCTNGLYFHRKKCRSGAHPLLAGFGVPHSCHRRR